MKLSELKIFEGRMSDLHLEMQETIMSKFKLSDDDAADVLDFAQGMMDLEDLSIEARESLFTHYEHQHNMTTPTARMDIKKLLKKDLGL